jgi:hypothetical protein
MSTEDVHHPTFPQPSSSSDLLWRYMDEHKFQWLVTERRLFMARADLLGDPLEGTTPAGHNQWWREKIATAATEEERLRLARNQAVDEAWARKFRPLYYVTCWHRNQSLNPRMWSSYTKSFEAVAVQATFASLKAVLPKFVEVGLVRYIDYATADLPSMNRFEWITHKDERFRFENEVRAVAIRPAVPELGELEFDNASFKSESDPSLTIFAPTVDVKRLIGQVVLHPCASVEFGERMSRLCALFGLPSPSKVTVKPSIESHRPFRGLC